MRNTTDIIPNNDPNTEILCSKLLNQTDLQQQFIVPAELFRKLPLTGYVEGESVIAVDQNGKRWEFPLRVRNGKYPKPTFPPARWHPFVEEFGLGDGDAVVFYTRRDGADGEIQIRGMRRTMFLGKPNWIEVPKKDY